MYKETQIKSQLFYVYNKIVNGLEEPLKSIVLNESFIAGGAIRSLAGDEEVNDYDIFFTSQDAIDRVKIIINRMLTNKDKISDREVMYFNFKQNTTDIEMICLTNNAVTFHCAPLNKKVQLILINGGSPEKVIKKFDFTNSMGYYLPLEDKLQITSEMCFAIDRKKLYFNADCIDPVYSVQRMFNFLNKGYTISRSELLNLVLAAAGDTSENQTKFKEGKDFYLNGGQF